MSATMRQETALWRAYVAMLFGRPRPLVTQHPALVSLV